ncbi:MAG: type IV pilus secretin PilQ, partial [Desulfatitalea sp.]|nr:type IV pilus secretin PilQ [Desulfatitalea sp.]
NVTNAPWDQVFMGILNSQGLDYEWEGEIVRIVTIEDRERNLKNLEAEERIQAKRRELQIQAPLVTTIIPVDFSSAERLRENISKVLSAKQAGEPVGTVMVDTHTNSLIVQATPSDIDKIIPMIKALDRPTPQIHIEAHIVETTSSTARQLGVQWGGLYQNSNRSWWVSPNATGAVSGQRPGSSPGLDPPAGTGINFPANLSNATTDGAGLFLGLITEGTSGLLALQLSALEEEGVLNILSSPSITTLDNTKAVIESGDEVPIPVVLSDSSNVIYKEALLSLEVTPYVIQDDVLKLEILTTKNEVDFSRTVLTYPTIVTKKASTNVILFDGQTTVIGGLKKNTTQNSEAGVPWLRNIPLLGHFFKNTGKSDEMQELLIFITPHILKTRPVVAEQPAASDN